MLNFLGISNLNDQKVVKILENALNDSDQQIRFRAIIYLSKKPEKAGLILPKIRELYQDSSVHPSIKRYLLKIISEMGPNGEPLLELICSVLADQSWLMRKAAKDAVKRCMKKNVNVVGFLVKMLNEGDTAQKLAAATGIGEIGKDAKGAVGALAALLKDPMPELRAKAAWALNRMEKNAAPAEAALTEALKDESPAVQRFALKALKNFKKLTKEEKEEIKAMEEIEKEIKAWRKKFERIYPDEKPPKEDDKVETEPAKEYKNIFFLSHALPDFPWVQKAMQEIESWPGCRCWTCERDIPTGGDWLESIYSGLEAMTWYILFWSDKAETSKWTNEEIREAKTRHVSSDGKKPKISVVNLGKSNWPVLLSRYQGAMVKSDEDLRTWLNNLKTQVEF